MTDRDDFRGGNPPPSRKTQAYSFVEPQRIINLGDSAVEPTVPMQAVEALTVKDIINRLIERNLQAWRALPVSIRNVMIERPQDFQLIMAKNRKEGDFDYDIMYSGTVWHYSAAHNLWTIIDLVR